MCQGRTHALSGAVTGTAIGVFALHATLTGIADLAVLTAGFATVSDMDQCGSTASRSFGFITNGFAHVIRRVSGGHRHATHTLLGAALFTGLVWLAGEYRHHRPGAIILCVILAVGVASGMDALHPGQRRFRLAIRWGRRRRASHGIGYADILAVAGAIAVCATGWDLILISYAAMAGVLTHIAGDELTRNGCPFFWPITDKKFHLIPEWLRFTTGTWQERRILVPILTVTLAWLALWAAGAHLDVTTIHEYAARLDH